MAFPFTPVLDAFEDAIPPRNLSTYNATLWQLAWQGVDLQTVAGGTARAVVANPGRNVTNTVYNTDQEAFVTIQTLPAAAQAVVLYLRGKSPTSAITNGATNFYEADYTAVAGAANDTVSLFKRIGGVSTQLNGGAAIITRELVAGDQFGFSVAGSTLTVYANGVSVGSLFDQALTGTGVIGVAVDTANSAARLDNFGGGNSTAVAPFASVRAFQEAADPRAFQDTAFQRPDPTDAFITALHAFFQETAFQRPDPVQAFQDTAFDDEAFQEAADAFYDLAFQGDGFQQDERPPGSGITVTGVGAIASLEAFGVPDVIRWLGPGGVGSAETFGTAAVRRWLGPGGVSTAQALGVPDLIRWIGPGGVASVTVFGTTKVWRLIYPLGIASAEAFGRLTIIGGIQGPYQVAGVGAIASLEAFGTTKPIRLLGPGGIASAQTFGTTALRRLIGPGGIVTAQAFGTPDAVRWIGPAGISSGEVLGTTSRLIRQLAQVGLASAETFGTTRVLRLLRAVNITAGENFGIATVTVGPTPGTIVPSAFGGTLLADRGAFDMLIGDVEAEQEQLADVSAEFVFVADGETWLVQITDMPAFTINVGDGPAGG